MMSSSIRLVGVFLTALVCLALLLAPCSLALEHGAAAPKAAQHAEADGKPNPLAFDPDLAVWTAVIFLLLFFILHKFAWPQIAAALDARERSIADNIAAAAAKNEEARQLLAEHETKLAAVAGEVRGLLEEARRDAETTKSRIVAEARKAADDERNRALREIDKAKDGAIQQLAVASANVAIDLAKKVVREKLTADEQATLVRNAMDRLAVAVPSKN
jgi:F-type H+-transporting ATPase subunit b